MLPKIWKLVALRHKSQQMIDFILLLNQDGKKRFVLGLCLICGSNKTKFEHFPDKISRREYEISGMCQKCQMTTFND